MGKLLIAAAALMLVAVDNGRADDQVSPARQLLPPPWDYSLLDYTSRTTPDRPTCPIISGDRAVTCGYLAEQFELYCCK